MNQQKSNTIQKQQLKKYLVFAIMFLLFAVCMWLIFAPSDSDKEAQLQGVGFNADIPDPKGAVIIEDKKTAYEQEAIQIKADEKRRTLQDYAFMLDENEKPSPTPHNAIQSSAHAYQDVSRQLNSWYDQPAAEEDDQELLALEYRIQELEQKLAETENSKHAEDKQLEFIEKTYQIAAKYSPQAQTQVTPGEQPAQTTTVKASAMREKVIPKPISHVRPNVISRLGAPLDKEEFIEQYSKPRNLGFLTAAGNETMTEKNAILACVYRAVTLSDGKEVQLRLLEPFRAGETVIPANTILTGSAKIAGERLIITISSIQHAKSVIPIELTVYDLDGLQGIHVPNSTELNAAKEIAANMGTQMGSSITITDDAGSQLVADMGRNLIQGTSQYISKKMREVKVTLKANYMVLLLPK